MAVGNFDLGGLVFAATYDFSRLWPLRGIGLPSLSVSAQSPQTRVRARLGQNGQEVTVCRT